MLNTKIGAIEQGSGGAGGSSNQITNPALNPSLQGKTGIQFFQDLLPSLVGIGFLIGAVIFFFIMIIGAIQWTTSGGDKAQLEAARGKVTSAIVGVIILLSTFALIKVIEDFFGISILTLDILSQRIE